MSGSFAQFADDASGGFAVPGLRPMAAADLEGLAEIDATIESPHYLHVGETKSEADALTRSWSLEVRPASEPTVEPNRLDLPEGEATLFAYRQVVRGIEEGEAVILEVGGLIVASALLMVRPEAKVIELVDLRVDYERRREGFATAVLFALVSKARERFVREGTRAVLANVAARNVPAMRLLAKAGFELSGVDVRRNTNHDLVREAATLVWYLPLEG